VMPSQPGLRLWTDDYNSVLPVLRWTKPKPTPTPTPSPTLEP
jgi:hypothetical protein